MSKNKLYSVLLIVIFSGYAYFFYSLYHSSSSNRSFCIIKNVTGYPCPSCGTTRDVKLLYHGELISSLQMNPFGIIVAMLMLVIPFWIIFDLLFKKDTFYRNYKKTETIISNKPLAITLIVLVIINWIWNIYKGI